MSEELTLRFCGEQITRLEGLVGYASMGENGYRERAKALFESAGTRDIAEAAITALLGDTARASNTETNRLPSAGEIRLWVDVVRPKEEPVSYREMASESDDDGIPTYTCGRCRDGWIFRTKRVIFKGSNVPQEYEYAGYCKCKGGWA